MSNVLVAHALQKRHRRGLEGFKGSVPALPSERVPELVAHLGLSGLFSGIQLASHLVRANLQSRNPVLLEDFVADSVRVEVRIEPGNVQARKDLDAIGGK